MISANVLWTEPRSSFLRTTGDYDRPPAAGVLLPIVLDRRAASVFVAGHYGPGPVTGPAETVAVRRENKARPRQMAGSRVRKGPIAQGLRLRLKPTATSPTPSSMTVVGSGTPTVLVMITGVPEASVARTV